MKMRDFSIGVRVGGGFGLLVCVVTVMAVLGWIGIATVQDNFRTLYVGYTSAVIDLAHVRADVGRYRALMLEAAQAPNKSEYEGMATTVAAVLVDGDSANLGHVGDSRIYLLRETRITQLTTDHSWVNEQIVSGLISPDQARSHPLRNVVTRALGGKTDLQVDMKVQKIETGDLLLLCSDGLTTMMGDEEIAGLVSEAKGDVEKAARSLVVAANAKGGEDNITVVILKFGE